jgi:hypothetical protein
VSNELHNQRVKKQYYCVLVEGVVVEVDLLVEVVLEDETLEDEVAEGDLRADEEVAEEADLLVVQDEEL